MKINEAEQAIGITKKNIRFYEQEGLLNPSRNLSNGYRDYSEQDLMSMNFVPPFSKSSISASRSFLGIIGTLAALLERLKEIKGGELDEASKY